MKTLIAKKTSLDVDVTRFTKAVNDYIYAYGVKQVLNDAHASITKKAYPDKTADERHEMKMALVNKKLASLYEGKIAQARASRGDEVEKLAWTLAETALLKDLPRIGRKRAEFKTVVWNALVEKQLESKRDHYMTKAREALGTPVESEEAMIDVDAIVASLATKPDAPEMDESDDETDESDEDEDDSDE